MGHICRAASREMCTCLFCKPSLVQNVKADQGHFHQWGGETTRPMQARPACLTITLGSASSEGNVLCLLPVWVLILSQCNVYQGDCDCLHWGFAWNTYVLTCLDAKRSKQHQQHRLTRSQSGASQQDVAENHPEVNSWNLRCSLWQFQPTRREENGAFPLIGYSGLLDRDDFLLRAAPVTIYIKADVKSFDLVIY